MAIFGEEKFASPECWQKKFASRVIFCTPPPYKYQMPTPEIRLFNTPTCSTPYVHVPFQGFDFTSKKQWRIPLTHVKAVQVNNNKS